MHNAVRYLLLFIVAMALQIFIFDAISLGMYVYPLVYTAFVILLPMNAPPIAVLISGLSAGVCMDFFAGTGGIHTIATLFISYIRHFALNLTVGKEYAAEGGMPSVRSIGPSKFLRYVSIMVAAQCFIYFTFEAMNWKYYHITLIKILLSYATTLLFVWMLSLLFTARTLKRL